MLRLRPPHQGKRRLAQARHLHKLLQPPSHPPAEPQRPKTAMNTTLDPNEQASLQYKASLLRTRTFDGRTPFAGDPLYIDEALTLIAAALTILANILAHSHEGPNRTEGD